MVTTVDILTPCSSPRPVSLLGNEAVARGALEAGVRGVFAYPGTPSTEISETLRRVSEFQRHPRNAARPDIAADAIHFEYSVNEKIAVEKAIAFSLGGRSALCCMKSAGLNVALDPLMTIPYQLSGRGLVIVVCDDPGCFSSTTEQDSRHFGPLASVPVLNPASPEEARWMTREAFALARALQLPVLLRMTTRVSHSRGIVRMGDFVNLDQTPKFERTPRHLNIPSRTAAAHRSLLEKLESAPVKQLEQRATVVRTPQSRAQGDSAIIACGVTAAYIEETLYTNRLEDRVALIKAALSFPFPEATLAGCLSGGIKRALVLEELDPVIEEQLRLTIQRRRLDCQVFGKGYAGLSRTGEYGLKAVNRAVAEFLNVEIPERPRLPTSQAPFQSIPPRPPVLCPGCPHRATFYALKLAAYQKAADLVLCGDIGCFAMGALPPFQLMDTIHHMGMSLSMAQGLSQAFESPSGKAKMVALVGDGTFFHSGLASLMNAVYTRANITVVIFDNRTIGMTGQQAHPGAGNPQSEDAVDLPALLKAIGVGFVQTVDPNDLKACYRALQEAMDHNGVAVVVAKSPCVFLHDFKQQVSGAARIEVDPTRCNTCGNQRDETLFCSRVCSPVDLLAKARAKLTAGSLIDAGQQACPANICNHGFFSAVVAGDYKSALRIVRDKTLFTRVCGEICPRPCEFLFKSEAQAAVPIREIKHFIAAVEENLPDCEVQKARVAGAAKKGLSVAVVGSGPAGLSAAYDLIQEGYAVTVFEREGTPGGLLNTVIPAFRMDKDSYRREIELLKELGVLFRFNCSLGRDITLDQLTREHSAVVLAVGMGRSSPLEAVDGLLPQGRLFEAIEFLYRFNRDEMKLPPGAKVLVVGGGNSAVDAARAAKRIGCEVVSIIYRRSRDAMPAFEEEIEAALAEGVKLVTGCVVASCAVNELGRLTVSLKGFKDDADRGTVECDVLVTAIGQRGDREPLKGADLRLNAEDRIIVEEATGHSGYKNVFAAGDLCADNHASLIGAIAGGKRAAVGVRRLLEGYPHPYEGLNALRALNENPRAKMSLRPDEAAATGLRSPEMLSEGLYLVQPCAKCNHCTLNFGCPALIQSGGKVVIDQNQCSRCGQCIYVCVNDAIGFISAATVSLPAENILMQE